MSSHKVSVIEQKRLIPTINLGDGYVLKPVQNGAGPKLLKKL